MVKEDIETVIDKLYDLVKAGSKVTVRKAALALSLTEEQVEKLALILEESGLIEVQYTLGGSVLTPKKIESQASLIPFAQPVQTKGSEILEEVKGVENVAEFIEKDFIERLSKTEKALAAAGSGKDLTKKNIEEIRKELEFLHQRLKNFQASIKKIEVGEVSFEEQLVKYQTQLSELEKTGQLKESPGGRGRNTPEFLAHFLMFLIAWFQALIASAKKAQAKGAKPAVGTGPAKVFVNAGVQRATAMQRQAKPAPSKPPAALKPGKHKRVFEAKPRARKARKNRAHVAGGKHSAVKSRPFKHAGKPKAKPKGRGRRK